MPRCLPLLAVQDPPLDDPSPGRPFEPTLRSYTGQFPQARLVVFAELHPCGSRLGTAREQAEPLDGKRVQWLCRLARELNIWLIPGTSWELGEDGNVYNTAIVAGPSGEIAARYRKCFRGGRGKRSLPGASSWWRTCPRSAASASPSVMTMTPGSPRWHASSPGWRRGHHPVHLDTHGRPPRELVLARAAAIANQVFVVNLNAAAPGGVGQSIIAGPEGEVIYQAGQTPVAMTQVLDLDQVEGQDVRNGRAEQALGTVPGIRPALALPTYAGRIAHLWDTMVTDTRGYLSCPAAEAGHLALWTGRLAYADPAWKPARGPSPAVRDPASLAPGPAAFTEIASAMHYTADSLARAARTDLDAICTAASARRLYVTTRSLPELNMTYPGPMPMRLATGSPPRSRSTRTPPMPPRRCCTPPPKSPLS